VWNWWKSLCAKPQLWAVFTGFFGLMIAFPDAASGPLAEAARPIGAAGAIVSMLIALRNWNPEATSRGQITIPDIVFFAAALIILAGFARPIYQLLNDNASELSAGSGYLLQMVVPGLLVTMLIIFFALATTRGGR